MSEEKSLELIRSLATAIANARAAEEVLAERLVSKHASALHWAEARGPVPWAVGMSRAALDAVETIAARRSMRGFERRLAPPEPGLTSCKFHNARIKMDSVRDGELRIYATPEIFATVYVGAAGDAAAGREQHRLAEPQY